MKKGTIFDIRKKISRTHEMISTSYHESGHVVYSLICGMRVSSVCIFQSKRSNRVEGFCYYETPNLSKIQDPNLLLSLVNYEIGIKYAGLTAEKHFFKTISGSDKFPIFLRDGSSDDTLSAAAIIRQFNVVAPGKKRYEFKKKKIKQVLEDLKKYWEDVTLLAHALFSKKKLSFLDIKNLFLKKSSNKKFWRAKFKSISSIFDNTSALDENFLKITLGL